jgi:AcrR family transcriptional regulator
MNTAAEPRSYNNEKRLNTSEETKKKILLAAIDLWLEMPIANITLDAVAKKAGVSTRTILRKFNSREGLFEACITDESLVQDVHRIEVEAGNIDQIIDCIYDRYEREGNAVIRTLSIETEMKLAAQIVERGRQDHTRWCEEVFAPFLPSKENPKRQEKIAAFYVATDVYQWKLLRRDFKYSLEKSKAITKRILNGLAKNQ